MHSKHFLAGQKSSIYVCIFKHTKSDDSHSPSGHVDGTHDVESGGGWLRDNTVQQEEKHGHPPSTDFCLAAIAPPLPLFRTLFRVGCYANYVPLCGSDYVLRFYNGYKILSYFCVLKLKSIQLWMLVFRNNRITPECMHVCQTVTLYLPWDESHRYRWA